MAVPDAPFEEAIMLGMRYRRFNDSGNGEAFQKTYNEFLSLKDQFPNFNDKVTLASAFLSAYNGTIARKETVERNGCNCTKCKRENDGSK